MRRRRDNNRSRASYRGRGARGRFADANNCADRRPEKIGTSKRFCGRSDDRRLDLADPAGRFNKDDDAYGFCIPRLDTRFCETLV